MRFQQSIHAAIEFHGAIYPRVASGAHLRKLGAQEVKRQFCVPLQSRTNHARSLKGLCYCQGEPPTLERTSSRAAVCLARIYGAL